MAAGATGAAGGNAGGSGIGDNQVNIGEVANKLDGLYDNLKSTASTAYAEYCNSIYVEWKGEDEEAFEKRTSEVLITYLTNCAAIINSTKKFICQSGNKWKEWHRATAESISSAYGVSGNSSILIAQDVTPVNEEDFTPVHKESSGSYDPQNRGLQNGLASVEPLKAATKTMFDTIKSASDNAEEIKTETAFIGETQSAAMNSMIAHIDEVFDLMTQRILGRLNTDISTISAGYVSQENAVAGSAEEASSKMDAAVGGN